MYHKQCHSDDNMLSALIFETRPTVSSPDLHYSSIEKIRKSSIGKQNYCLYIHVLIIQR